MKFSAQSRTLFKDIPEISKEISGTSNTRKVSTIASLWFFLFLAKGRLLKSDFALNGEYNGRCFSFNLRNTVDIAVLREVFVEKEYKWKLPNEPKIIIDLGAHFGDTAIFYNLVYPEAKIIAVEPDPDNYDRLVKNTESIENIEPVNAAVGPEDGSATLFSSKSSLGHSVYDRGDDSRGIDVQQMSLSTLFKKFDVSKADLIKFDIEGAEFPLLDSIEPKEYADAYIGELHYDLQQDYDSSFIESKFKNFKLEVMPISGEQRYILKAY